MSQPNPHRDALKRKYSNDFADLVTLFGEIAAKPYLEIYNSDEEVMKRKKNNNLQKAPPPLDVLRFITALSPETRKDVLHNANLKLGERRMDLPEGYVGFSIYKDHMQPILKMIYEKLQDIYETQNILYQADAQKRQEEAESVALVKKAIVESQKDNHPNGDGDDLPS
jgi:hypothetical protein